MNSDEPSSQEQRSNPSYRCLIVEDDTLVGLGLKSLLEKLGHQVVGQVSTAQEAQSLYRQNTPDVVLVDIRLDGVDGIDLASRLLEIRNCPILITSAYSDESLIQRATAAGVFGYLIKPVNLPALAAQLEVAVARFREQAALRAEKDALNQTLENRKIIERAKGILMKRLTLPEPDAHKKLQQESQKRRVSVIELAKKIVESEETLSGF